MLCSSTGSLFKADPAVVGAIDLFEHAVDEIFHALGVLSESLKVVLLHKVKNLNPTREEH